MAVLQAFFSILCTYTVLVWMCLSTVSHCLCAVVIFLKYVGEVALELPVRWDLNMIFLFLRKEGLGAALRV